MVWQLGNRISLGVIPVGDADNPEIWHIVADTVGPIGFTQWAKCITPDTEFEVAGLKANGHGLGDIPSFPGLID